MVSAEAPTSSGMSAATDRIRYAAAIGILYTRYFGNFPPLLWPVLSACMISENSYSKRPGASVWISTDKDLASLIFAQLMKGVCDVGKQKQDAELGPAAPSAAIFLSPGLSLGFSIKPSTRACSPQDGSMLGHGHCDHMLWMFSTWAFSKPFDSDSHGTLLEKLAAWLGHVHSSLGRNCWVARPREWW